MVAVLVEVVLEVEAAVAVKDEDGTGTEGSIEILCDTEHALLLSMYTGREAEVEAEVDPDGEEEAFVDGPWLPWPIVGASGRAG